MRPILSKLCALLITAALLGACEGWLVPEPTPVSWVIPSSAPTAATPAYLLGSTPTSPTLTPNATITLTPRFSPTPPLGATSTLSWIMLTATAAGPAIVNEPHIEYFVIYPTDAKPGDLISLFWKTSNGTEAAIWRVNANGTPGRTWKVEAEGQMSLEVSASSREEEFVLSVTNGIKTAEQSASVTVGCAATWFFEPEPQTGCPEGSAGSSSALFQGFQNGQMIWLQATNQIIVLYKDSNQPAWIMKQNSFSDGMPEDDPALAPPEGLRQPRRELGLVWRDTPGLRDRIGWAIGDPAPFTSTYQVAIFGFDERGLFFSDPAGAIIQLLPNGESWSVAGYLSPPTTP